jgi:predicted metal-binding membrane protein
LTNPARLERALIALLLGVAGLAWWWTAERMKGMDRGPWTGLGALGWFLGIWIVMMAAMMLPSVAPAVVAYARVARARSAIPTVALYARLARDRTALAPLVFTSGYLAVWAAAGLVAFGLAGTASHVAGDILTWSRGGRWLAGAALLCAAVYQLTPLKEACLSRCRTPLGLMLSSRRRGRLGGFGLGLSSGAWCAGCCWGLMASLFALGVMSIAWAALVAALVALEKILPWRRIATWGAGALLAGLGILMLVAPDLVPALTVPAAGPMPMSG